MKLQTLSLITFVASATCLFTASNEALAQERFSAKRVQIGERALRPAPAARQLSVLASKKENSVCQAIMSPQDGVFPAVSLSNGEGFEYELENESEGAVIVSLEVRDAQGQSQGNLNVTLPALASRRLGLSFWNDALSESGTPMQTTVRVHSTDEGADLSLVVAQRKISSAGQGSSYTMDCIADGCTLRSIYSVNETSELAAKNVAEPETGGPGDKPSGGPSEPPTDPDEPDDPNDNEDKNLPTPGPGTGPHGPH